MVTSAACAAIVTKSRSVDHHKEGAKCAPDQGNGRKWDVFVSGEMLIEVEGEGTIGSEREMDCGRSKELVEGLEETTNGVVTMGTVSVRVLITGNSVVTVKSGEGIIGDSSELGRDAVDLGGCMKSTSSSSMFSRLAGSDLFVTLTVSVTCCVFGNSSEAMFANAGPRGTLLQASLTALILPSEAQKFSRLNLLAILFCCNASCEMMYPLIPHIP